MTIATLLTNRGRAILAARVPGDPPIASIVMAVGDGNGNFPTPNPAQVALVNERWRAAGAVAIEGPRLAFVATIPAAVGGFEIREVGVFIGNPGAEELAIVSQFDGRRKYGAGENGMSDLTPVVTLDYTGSVVGAFTITLDENLARIDPNLHRTINARASAPPGSPADGSVYAIASGATGDFAGRGGQIAKRRGTAWAYETPLDGHVVREQGSAGAWWQKSGADYVAYAFPVASHTHPISEVTGLQAALDAKPNLNHTHSQGDITNLTADLAARVLRAGDDMAGALGIVPGSATAPGLDFVGDADTGIYRPAPDTIGFAAGGVNRARINAAGIETLAGLTANGSLGDATRVLTGGATAQWRTLDEIGVIPPNILTGTDAIWDGLAPGIYTLSFYAQFPTGARVTIHPRSEGVDAQQNFSGTGFNSNGFVGPIALDFMMRRGVVNPVPAPADVYRQSITLYIDQNRRIGTNSTNLFPEESLRPVGTFTSGHSFNPAPEWLLQNVNGFSIRGAAGRTIRVWHPSTYGGAVDFTPSESIVIQSVRLTWTGL